MASAAMSMRFCTVSEFFHHGARGGASSDPCTTSVVPAGASDAAASRRAFLFCSCLLAALYNKMNIAKERRPARRPGKNKEKGGKQQTNGDRNSGSHAADGARPLYACLQGWQDRDSIAVSGSMTGERLGPATNARRGRHLALHGLRGRPCTHTRLSSKPARRKSLCVAAGAS